MILSLLVASASFFAAAPIKQEDWVTPTDYSLIRPDKVLQGDSVFRATVSVTGRVIACEIAEPSGSARLDERACFLIQKRAQFRPARDVSGEPILAVHRNRVRWWMPGMPGPKRYIPHDILLHVKKLPAGVKSPATVGVALLVDASGVVEDCRAGGGDLPDSLKVVACDQARLLLKPVAARDEQGVAGRSVQNADIVFAVEPATGG